MYVWSFGGLAMLSMPLPVQVRGLVMCHLIPLIPPVSADQDG